MTEHLRAVDSTRNISLWLPQIRLLIEGRVKLGLHSNFTRYGLRRDLTVPITTPSAKIPVSVRPLLPSDIPLLLPENNDHLEPHERVQIAWRVSFLAKAPKGCFVAVDERTGKPCYMQWLFSSSQNPLIRKLGGFPDLEPDEALLENAFTPVEYRGLRIMSAAMALIAERAADFGARYVLTFVGDDNIPSLKGCARAGFHPHLLNKRVRHLYGMYNSNTFEKLPED